MFESNLVWHGFQFQIIWAKNYDCEPRATEVRSPLFARGKRRQSKKLQLRMRLKQQAPGLQNFMLLFHLMLLLSISR